VNIIFASVGIAALFVVFITVLFGCEMRANRKRIERGEPPKRHHNATDDPPPVNVIDWSNIGRKK